MGHGFGRTSPYTRYNSMSDLDVTVMNLRDGFAQLNDGRLMPITTMLDSDGDETNDPELAVTFVAGEGKEWFTGRIYHISLFEVITQ